MVLVLASHQALINLIAGFRVRGTTRCARNREDMAFLKHLPNYHLLEVVELDMLDPVDKWAPHMKGCSYFIHSARYLLSSMLLSRPSITLTHTASPFTRCASSPEELITPAVQGTKNFLQYYEQPLTSALLCLTSFAEPSALPRSAASSSQARSLPWSMDTTRSSTQGHSLKTTGTSRARPRAQNQWNGKSLLDVFAS